MVKSEIDKEVKKINEHKGWLFEKLTQVDALAVE